MYLLFFSESVCVWLHIDALITSLKWPIMGDNINNQEKRCDHWPILILMLCNQAIIMFHTDKWSIIFLH